jgi:uncharacterized membrane protein
MIGLWMLAGCSEADRTVGQERAVRDHTVVAAPTPQESSVPGPTPPSDRWELVFSGEGTALVYSSSGATSLRLFCPPRQDRILINVPSFRSIGSEERLTFGSGSVVEALVADTRGDRLRGGVSATGRVPSNLAALIDGPVSATYGAQRIGPHPAPGEALVRDFTAACGESKPSSPSSANQAGASACLMQDGGRLSVAPLRGIGTEPFWAVQVEGRCVTYSHPEDQQGTRIWTRYTSDAAGSIWRGALGTQPFILRMRKQPRCSDGMSDQRYPFALELTVGGEQRSGCAAPSQRPA